MKVLPLLCLSAMTSLSTLGQYSATTLTRKVAPRPQPAPAQARPAGGAIAVQAAPAAPVDPAKVQAEKRKSESDLIKYHRQRAEAGSDNAQYELGIRFLTGNGVEKDEKLGREWLARSAKSGNPKAVKKLEELGPAPEEPKAIEGTK
jgi:TPR repeat protein